MVKDSKVTIGIKIKLGPKYKFNHESFINDIISPRLLNKNRKNVLKKSLNLEDFHDKALNRIKDFNKLIGKEDLSDNKNKFLLNLSTNRIKSNNDNY